MNRGRRVHVSAVPPAGIASMRPRFMNRGSIAVVILAAVENPGFNEAPIHESGKTAAAIRLASSPQASMRPRFMNRGRLSRNGRAPLVASLQ